MNSHGVKKPMCGKQRMPHQPTTPKVRRNLLITILSVLGEHFFSRIDIPLRQNLKNV